MNTNLRWRREYPGSTNNFNLVLENPQELDCERMDELLKRIEREKHRALTLSTRACKELRRWFDEPATPLKSEAYVLISNWFMTRSGDRHSLVSNRCEELWDALFPCRPAQRFSSPKAGQNHIVIPSAFENFWRQVLAAQGDDAGQVGHALGAPIVKGPSRTTPEADDGSSPGHLRATFHKEGVRCEVEGSPRALADFLQLVSSWEASRKA